MAECEAIRTMYEYIEFLINVMSKTQTWTEFKQYDCAIEHMFQAAHSAAQAVGKMESFHQLDVYLYSKFTDIYCETNDRFSDREL